MHLTKCSDRGGGLSGACNGQHDVVVQVEQVGSVSMLLSPLLNFQIMKEKCDSAYRRYPPID